jgi:two-component system chemotaxis response regulator CheB
MAPSGPNLLPQLLQPRLSLPISLASDGEIYRRRHIYVAVADRHLMIENECLRLSRGPKESHARPSVDVLFRSAAYYGGPRVIGIVLTGQLDDGTAGLWAIKDRGGMAIVQDPADAAFPSMPRSAREHVAIDHALRLEDMPEVLHRLVGENREPGEAEMPDEKLAAENAIAAEKIALKSGVRALGEPSFHTCPECHGSMVAIREGTFTRYRCHTGHGFSQGAMIQEGTVQAERSLWIALAQLEETQVLREELAAAAEARGKVDVASRLRQRAEEIDALKERVRLLAYDHLLDVQDV